MTPFTIEPVGRFSLAAAQDFAGGFPAGIGAHGTAAGLLMTFPVEGWRDSAAVDVWQTADGTIHGERARLRRPRDGPAPGGTLALARP